MFVNYHLHIGVDRIFLFFDDPEDVAINDLSSYDSVTCIRCDDEHWKKLGCDAKSNIETRQIVNANLALTWARAEGYQWIAHIDNDELIYLENDLEEVLLSVPQEIPVLWLPTLEAIPYKMKHKKVFEEISLFKVLPTKDHQRFRGKHPEAFFEGEFFRGHIGGKSLVRTTEQVHSLRLHRPLDKNRQELPSITLRAAMLLHYDCYDFDAWFVKWLRRYDGTASAGGRPNRKMQFMAFKALYEEGGMEAMIEFYRRLYFLPYHLIPALREEGMLREIHLNKAKFSRNHVCPRSGRRST